jgi:hypothetical protein
LRLILSIVVSRVECASFTVQANQKLREGFGQIRYKGLDDYHDPKIEEGHRSDLILAG